jgi:hypothetical protein
LRKPEVEIEVDHKTLLAIARERHQGHYDQSHEAGKTMTFHIILLSSARLALIFNNAKAVPDTIERKWMKRAAFVLFSGQLSV